MRAVELSEAVPAISAADVARSPNGEILVLARLHGQPLGQLAVTPPASGMPPGELAEHLWSALPEIAAHLADDGLPVPGSPTAAGVGASPEPPRCLARRRAATADGPFVTVLIATRDRPESLARCLDSVAELDYPRFEVVVVDSAPSDHRTADLLAARNGTLGPAALRYVREPRPGLAVAHNRGLAEARGQWLAITDDDVVVDRQWLASIAESAASDPAVACVTGLILPAELETTAQVLVEQYAGFAKGYTPRLYDLARNRPDDPLFPLAAGRFGSGANMAFATDVLRRLGGFDPATGAGTTARGGDDLAGFVRVLRAGHAIAYQPASMVWHWHRRELGDLRGQVRQYGTGLGAYLTSAVVHDPALMVEVVRGLGPAVRHLLATDSPKNRRKGPSYPHELDRAERLGLLLGPFAYAVSRWRSRRLEAA